MNTIFIVLPILTVLMFDLGLTLEGKDFLLVIKRYKAVLAGMIGQLVVLPLCARTTPRPTVSGDIQMGVSTEISDECEQIDYTYTTHDARLGTNSGHHYFSDVDDINRNARLFYDANLQVLAHPNHTLAFTLKGTHDWIHALGTRAETIHDQEGQLVSNIQGQYDHPHETHHDITAGTRYTYRMRRQGETLVIAYHYRHEDGTTRLEQHVDHATGWALFTDHLRTQQSGYRYHHATLDYTYPITRGHALDMGLCYDRRQIDEYTDVQWDTQVITDAHYRHLTQYGALYARYRMQAGPLQAVAELEYRATKMQQRWLHDIVPTAMLRYRIDSVHSLTARYKMLIIRPEAFHLDTTRVTDAFTQSFGNDALTGTHVHNTSLTYRMALPRLTLDAEMRYITAKDGLNALWMERDDVRIYTWGNEGIRHAVSVTPSIDSHLSHTTLLHVDATVLWDQRIAAAINMSNANWGVRTAARLEQQLPHNMTINLLGEYSYHNTLDLYSYAGHGGAVGADWQMAFLAEKNLQLKVNYTGHFTPNIHVTQGAYVGTIIFRPGCLHTVSLNLSYVF